MESTVELQEGGKLRVNKVQRRKKSKPQPASFPLLSLPLDIRLLILDLVLVPLDDLISSYFNRFMPILPSNQNAVLHACHQLRIEGLELLYSRAIHLHGIDLTDLSSRSSAGGGLLVLPWFRDSIRRIRNLQVRLCLFADVGVGMADRNATDHGSFTGRWSTFAIALPFLRKLRIDVRSEEEWKYADGSGFEDFLHEMPADIELEIRQTEAPGRPPLYATSVIRPSPSLLSLLRAKFPRCDPQHRFIEGEQRDSQRQAAIEVSPRSSQSQIPAVSRHRHRRLRRQRGRARHR